MATDQSITTLLQHIATLLEDHSSEIAKISIAALEACFRYPSCKSAQRVAQCEELDDLLNDLGSPHLSVVAGARHAIHWSDSGGAAKPEALQNRLAFAELIGPSGMIRNTHCRIGLFLQCSQTAYPKHRHAAEELYFVLGGTAYWQRDSIESSWHAPGSFIHHESWENHSMTTGIEPLLAIWCWTGDIRYGQYELKET